MARPKTEGGLKRMTYNLRPDQIAWLDAEGRQKNPPSAATALRDVIDAVMTRQQITLQEHESERIAS